MSGPYKSTQAKPNQQSLIKPAELIDVVELTPLQLIDRRTFNLMLGEAWEDIGEDVEHSIPKNELTANHREKQRLSDSIERLMGALVKIKLQRDGQTYTQTFHLLEQVHCSVHVLQLDPALHECGVSTNVRYQSCCSHRSKN